MALVARLFLGAIFLLHRQVLTSELASFQGHSFSHMEIYELHGEEFLVVAQANQLINIRADFKEKFITQIGPRNESINCLPSQVQQNLVKCHTSSMDNYMKAMTVHNGHIFICMSYLSGTCASEKLVNGRLSIDFTEIDRKMLKSHRNLLCRNVEAKTQLTVAKKLLDNGVVAENGLYLSMPFCTAKNLDTAVESVISIVDIKTLQSFQIGVSFSHFITEILPLNSKRWPNALAYHYSFKYTDGPFEYVYFLVTAKEVVNSVYSQVRIGRLCTSDLYMSGYVEMHVYCTPADADLTRTYGYVGESATFVKAGSRLAAALNVSADEPILFLSTRVMDSSLINWRQGVCAVPISAINDRLNRIVVDCQQGQAYHGPAYIRDHVKCVDQPEPKRLEYGPQCTPFKSQPEWMGMVGLKEQHKYLGQFIVTLDPSFNITSLAALSLYNGATALYVGTSNGRLLRFNVLDLERHWLFEEAPMNGGAVLAIRIGKSRLYTLTAKEVASHVYANCELQYQSCGACLRSNNPHCVWSNLDQGGCQTWNRPGLPSPGSHVSTVTGCMQVGDVRNSDVCVDQQLERVLVEVQATNAPSVTYYCYYMADGAAIMENMAAEIQLYHQGGSVGIRCQVEMAGLRRFLGNLASRNLTLLLSSSPYKPDQYFVSVSVQVFSCKLHQNCSSCAAGHPMCGWCSLNSACAHQLATNCSEERVAGSVVRASSNNRVCPAVLPSGDRPEEAAEVALPSGMTARLRYRFVGYQAFMQRFTCTVTCPAGEPAEFEARPANFSVAGSEQQLECHTGILQYSAVDATTKTCSIAFYWSDSSGRKRLLDTSGAAGRLVLYKCELMATSCGDCTLGISDSRFRCVWCPVAAGGSGVNTADKCLASDQCPLNSFAVRRGGLCPAPRIFNVTPSKLAPYSDLRLTIEGSNLGNTWESIKVKLQAQNESLADDLECSLQPEGYTPGRRFSCTVARTPLLGAWYRMLVSLPALAKRSQSELATASSEILSVAQPTLFSLDGSIMVQQNGHAIVQLLGSDLDAGSDFQVNMLSDQFLQVPTQVQSRNSSHAIIRLGSFHNPGRYFAGLNVQGRPESKQDFRSVALEVVPDAELSINSESALHRTGLIPAGGLDFELPGLRLDSVRQPRIEFFEIGGHDRRMSAECRAAHKLLLVCPSPPVPPAATRSRRSHDGGFSVDLPKPPTPSPARFTVTIHLDVLTHVYPANLTLLPDPDLHQVGWITVQLHPDWKQLEPGRRELQLRGRHLRPGLLHSDIVISVGKMRCDVSAVQTRSDGIDLLTCRHFLPPTEVGSDLPVKAQIGGLYFDLGHLTYAVQFNWTYIYVAIPAVLALLFAVPIAVLVHAHQRAKRRQEKSSRIEVQINLLEAQVSQNCRDAFAELQLNSSGDRKLADEWCAPVPIRSFAEFASYSCFAERYQDRHRTMDPLFADVVTPEAAAAALAAEPPEVRKALSQLHNLLLNEDFLLVMIAAMEAKSDKFMYQERNQFGSLLSALLYTDIGYFTRVLTRLIESLVARKQEASDNYKVVFRRCDSVAERLLPNWLAFLMYEHLSDRVAEPLHRLYWAMKLQIYKGPVDQLTGDSKYTINEQKLLKKEILFKEITLVFEDRPRVFSHRDQPEMCKCKVAALDCDSVHQVKEKILDAVYTQLQAPQSKRIGADRFDLACTFGSAGATGMREENSNERYLILTEVEDSDEVEGLQRLKRLASFPVGGESNSESSAVVFLLQRKELPAIPEPTAFDAVRFAKGATLAVGDFSQNSGSATWQRTLPEALNRSRQVEAPTQELSQYHLLVPSGAVGQALLDSGRKRKGRKAGGWESKSATSSRKRRPGVDRVEGQQIVSEVFYPVLLRTKRLLTDKITDLFSALFPAPKPEQLQPEPEKEVPLCLKYLFDLFDAVVQERQLSRDVAHVWKSNALMLRFYTHHLFNVDYLLDVEVPGPVRYCMSTISTLFMDACSVEKPAKPDKTSTAQRLLFVNEVAEFHPLVEAYYSTVKSGVREAESYAMERFELQVRMRHCRPFNRDAVLKEIFFGFVCRYKDEIIRELEQQRPVLSSSLIESLDFVIHSLSSASPYWSKAQTLSSTQSSTRPFHLAATNLYDQRAC